MFLLLIFQTVRWLDFLLKSPILITNTGYYNVLILSKW